MHYAGMDQLVSVRSKLETAFQLKPFESKPFKDLSAGMLQKANLCLTLHGSPSYILLDEPEAHLDTNASEALISCFQQLLATGVKIICATHTKVIWEPLAAEFTSQTILFPLANK